MVEYTNMTLRMACDEVFLRLEGFRGVENISRSDVVKAINRAVKEVIRITLPIKGWEYSQKMAVVNNQRLPTRFITHKRLLCKMQTITLGTTIEHYKEARYVSPREYVKLIHWETRNAWTQSTTMNPIYTFWGYKPVTGINTGAAFSQTIIKIYPNAETPDPEGTYILDEAFLEYYAYPTEIEFDTNLLPINYEYEEYVIKLALQKLYLRTSNDQQLLLLRGKLKETRQEIIDLYKAKADSRRRDIESFVPPRVPLTTKRPVEDEQPRRIV